MSPERVIPEIVYIVERGFDKKVYRLTQLSPDFKQKRKKQTIKSVFDSEGNQGIERVTNSSYTNTLYSHSLDSSTIHVRRMRGTLRKPILQTNNSPIVKEYLKQLKKR